MQKPEQYQNLINYLQTALAMLELEPESQLKKDVNSICDFLANPTFKIAVFAPFNYGKSTLLNALLGKKTVPIDIIPTTGAAISVKYGEELQTKITLKDGKEINEEGIGVLKRYAILDENRRMRDDVAAVDVFCPHPFLQTGVEFLDLPGTDDREAQEMLVRDKLLTANLIVQVLDARKLMTLNERENLRDWLLDRGINTVVFVVNFMNLLEPEDQKEVSNRMRFVAESFRFDLPANISNLYRVDALPALRARLKGETSAAQTTGLAAFESALQSIVAEQGEKTSVSVRRVEAIASQIRQAMQVQIETATAKLNAAREKLEAKKSIQQRAEKLVKQGFQSSNSDFQSWLYLPKLLEAYQTELAAALEERRFDSWRSETLRSEVVQWQEKLMEWVNKAGEFFDIEKPEQITIAFPEPPKVLLPPPPPSVAKKSGGIMPLAIAAGIGWLLGGPAIAAVVGGATYLLSDSKEQQPTVSPEEYQQQVKQAYSDAAKDYLQDFSDRAFASLQKYEPVAEKAINAPPTRTSLEVEKLENQLALLNNLSENL
ncbi:MAG: dynamin family protein, partial [Cyanobacteriota bacterium]|nr:dynamin family protein [Cyanobacteriota bacterium]